MEESSMDFYRRRPLAFVITICIAAFAAASFIPPLGKVLLIALLAVGVPISVRILTKKKAGELLGLPRSVFVALLAVFLMTSLLLSFAFYDVFAKGCAEYENGVIEARVSDVRSMTSFSAVYEVRLDKVGETIATAKGLLRSDNTSLSVGDVIRVKVVFSPLDDFWESWGPSHLSLLCDGYVFTCDTVGEVSIIGNSSGAIVFFYRLREAISAKISLLLDRDAAALVNAMLLGKRGELGVMEREFTYTGTKHLLAISGLHLAILSAGIDALLAKVRLRASVRRALSVLFVIFYAALTAFPISVVRAAIMLILYKLGGFIGRRGDRVTTLFVAVWLILCANPAAVYDLGLQLSFFATLGVILSTAAHRKMDRLTNRGLLIRVLRKLSGGVAVSVGAALCVLPLVWIYFGEVSTMSVFATLVLSVMCEALLTLALLYIPLCAVGFYTGASVIAGALSAVGEVFTVIVRTLAGASRLVSLRYPFVLPLGVILFAVLVFIFTKSPKYKRGILTSVALILSVLAFVSCTLMYGAANRERVSVDYMSVGTSDAVLFVRGDTSVLVDVGYGSSGILSEATDALADRLQTELDVLVLTNLNRGHIGFVRRLLTARRVHGVYIPEPSEEYELYVAADVADAAARCGAAVYSYTEGSQISLGELILELSPEYLLERSQKPVRAVRISTGEMDTVYVSTSSWEAPEVWEYTNGADFVIIGGAGPDVRGVPDTKVSEETQLIFISGDEVLDKLVPWLDGYTGRVLVGERIGIKIKP